MNKFAASFVFAVVAAGAAFSAQAADSDNVAQRAQRVEQPAWQRAANAPQNFAAQINQQPGRAQFAFRAVTPATDTANVPAWERAAAAPQNYAAQINAQPGRVASN
ncbi:MULTISPECIES: hypothetical protein [Silvimonas]|uniref:hypothetical protein n=1 Tax=Silvimonas TaxID=300264 RepID=UPI0024B3ADF2|nr:MULTISPECIES: hypothetical protein [Silvimonas]MDR3430011.1 hypothetical protein [Silvimonas sp.]